MVVPGTAYAAVDQTLILDGPGGESIGESQLSFTTDSGQSVPVVYYDEDEEDFDGVFIIAFSGDEAESGTLTYPGPDGEPRTVAVPAGGPGSAIRVNIGTGAVSVGPRPFIDSPIRLNPAFSTPTIYGEVGGTTMDIPQAQFGVVDIGGSERFLSFSPEKFDFATYGGSFSIPLGGFTIGGGYYTGAGENTSAGSLSPGGETGGFVLIGESSEFGTGVNLGTLGVDISTLSRVDFSQGHFKFGVPIPCKDGGGLFLPYGKVSYGETTIEHWTDISTPAYSPNEVGSSLYERLENERLGLGLGAYYLHPLAEDLFVGIGGEGTVNFNNYNLYAMQTVNVFAASDTVIIEQEDDDTSLALSAELSLTYSLTDNLHLNGFGRINYDEGFGQILNPLSGDDVLAGDTASIGTDDVTSYTFGGRIVLSF